MNIDRLIAMVDGILGDNGLCDGCEKEPSEYSAEYGDSCAICRRKSADKIIKILKKERKNDNRECKNN